MGAKCVHCDMPLRRHANRKCLFEATTFRGYGVICSSDIEIEGAYSVRVEVMCAACAYTFPTTRFLRPRRSCVAACPRCDLELAIP